MLLKSPNGGFVDASEEAVPRLIEGGFRPVNEDKPKTTKKRTTRARKTAPKKD